MNIVQATPEWFVQLGYFERFGWKVFHVPQIGQNLIVRLENGQLVNIGQVVMVECNPAVSRYISVRTNIMPRGFGKDVFLVDLIGGAYGIGWSVEARNPRLWTEVQDSLAAV